MSFSSRNSMASSSSRLGVQHMIDEGFRYPSLTELNGGQSMLYTPVHPGYDILWSPKRKWAVCLWTLVVGFTILIYTSFRKRRVSTITETLSTLYTIIVVAFWLTASCFVVAIIARFFTYSPTYAKRCFERFRECYNTVNLCRLRFEDRAYDVFLRIKKLFPSWPKRKRAKRTSSHKGKYRRQLGSQDKYKITTAGSSPERQELVSKDDDYDGYADLEYKEESESGTDFEMV